MNNFSSVLTIQKKKLKNINFNILAFLIESLTLTAPRSPGDMKI